MAIILLSACGKIYLRPPCPLLGKKRKADLVHPRHLPFHEVLSCYTVTLLSQQTAQRRTKKSCDLLSSPRLFVARARWRRVFTLYCCGVVVAKRVRFGNALCTNQIVACLSTSSFGPSAKLTRSWSRNKAVRQIFHLFMKSTTLLFWRWNACFFPSCWDSWYAPPSSMSGSCFAAG